MHEFGIARNIVAIVCERAGAMPVKRVTLEVGALSGVMADGAARDLQLWMVGPKGTRPTSCGVFKQPVGFDSRPLALDLASPVVAGCRFLLIAGKIGGADTLSEAETAGSIILATPPIHETIGR